MEATATAEQTNVTVWLRWPAFLIKSESCFADFTYGDSSIIYTILLFTDLVPKFKDFILDRRRLKTS